MPHWEVHSGANRHLMLNAAKHVRAESTGAVDKQWELLTSLQNDPQSDFHLHGRAKAPVCFSF